MSKRWSAAVVMVVGLFGLAANAQDWTKTYKVQGTPTLAVETDDARVDVRTCDCREVRVAFSGTNLKLSDFEIRESQSGDRIDVSIRERKRVHWGMHYTGRRELTVETPRESNLKLRTGDGAVRVANIKGSLDLHTGDGSLDLVDVDGRLMASTSDGPVRIDGRFDALEVRTGDGDAEVTARSGSKVSENWMVHTGDGRVRIRVPVTMAANLDVKTGDGGIKSDLPLTVDGYDSGHGGLHGKLNGGGSDFSIETGDGSITLEGLEI